MKKFLAIAILMFVTVGMVFAGAWTNVEKFQEYKAAKTTATEADETGNTTVAVAKYIEAADLAKSYATQEIEAWQRNSAAYVLIKTFKNTKEKALLVEAMTYLTDAKAIADTLNIGSLSEKIERNIDFCKTWLEVQ